MKNLFNRFVREEQGQDLIEYALLAGLISLAVSSGNAAERLSLPPGARVRIAAGIPA